MADISSSFEVFTPRKKKLSVWAFRGNAAMSESREYACPHGDAKGPSVDEKLIGEYVIFGIKSEC
jgi:hypothetical protein